MPGTAVVGLIMGDEGKGKIVDELSGDQDWVGRYQGATNADHTIIIDGRKYVTHALCTGVLRGIATFMAANMAVDPVKTINELAELQGAGITPGRILISERAHLLMPYHVALDTAREEDEAALRRIGTTKSGIGPVYSGSRSRYAGLKVGDLLDPNFRDILRDVIYSLQDPLIAARIVDGPVENPWQAMGQFIGAGEFTVASAMERLKQALAKDTRSALDEYVERLYDELEPYLDQIRPLVGNVAAEINRALRAGQKVLFEGAQGAVLDIDHGEYPFVTSSNTIPNAIYTAVNVPPSKIQRIIGVAKILQSRVGTGPFPTQIGDEGKEENPDGITDAIFCDAYRGDPYWLSRYLRFVGQEFGATTGRPRRVGYPDGVIARWYAWTSDVTEIALTKIDCWQWLKLKFCNMYNVDGHETLDVPLDLSKARPQYSRPYEFQLYRRGEFDKFQEPEDRRLATNDRLMEFVDGGFESLPPELQQFTLDYAKFVEKPITMISISPERGITVKNGVREATESVLT